MIAKLVMAYIHDHAKDSSLEEIKQSLEFLAHPHGHSTQKTALIDSFVAHLQSKVLPVLDKIPAGFYVASDEKKEQVLEVVVGQKGLFENVLSQVLAASSYEQLQREIADTIAAAMPEMSVVLVQSAKECDPALKTEIRKSFADGLVKFQINSALLGGMRILKDGDLLDTSWQGKLHALQSLVK